ncbi:Signal transduction histidine-protein kinase BarA [compost metagenome]
MPVKDGYQTTEYIRNEMNSMIPIIAMTAHSLVGEQERCYKVGMNAYVPKPFKQSVLLKAIKTVMTPDSEGHHKRIIDMSFLDEMSGGDPDFKKDMIGLFVEKIPAQALQLKEAFKNTDYDNVKKLAHNMKSSMDIFMLQDLSNCLSIIEEEASSGEFTAETLDKVNIFSCGIEEVVKILKEL